MENQSSGVVKFRLVLQQIGGGCDYTIGCGMKMVDLTAQTDADARIEARLYIENCNKDGAGFYRGESELSHVEVVAVCAPIPLADWKREYRTAEMERRNAAEMARKRAEFERLKRELREK